MREISTREKLKIQRRFLSEKFDPAEWHRRILASFPRKNLGVFEYFLV